MRRVAERVSLRRLAYVQKQVQLMVRVLGLAVATACANEIPNDVDSMELALDSQGEVIEVSAQRSACE